MNRILEWVVSGVIGAIIGMIIMYSWSFHLFPILNGLKAKVFGNTVTFTAGSGMTVKMLADHFTELMAESGAQHFVVSCTPEAASIVLANTDYQPQNSFVKMVEHIILRNGTKLIYHKIENPNNPQILICSSKQDCEKIANFCLKQQ